MIQIRLLIADRDTQYATALGSALVKNYPFYYAEIADGKVFDISDAIKKEINSKYDLILTDEQTINQISACHKDYPDNIVVLCDERIAEKEREGVLYKYAGAAELSAALQIIYDRIKGKERLPVSDLHTEIIGFTGASGGVGKTSIAISVSRELSLNHNCSVLYLSLEELESTEVYIIGQGGRGTLSDFIYYAFSKSEAFLASNLDNFIITDEYGLNAFRPSKGINELKFFPSDKLSFFIEKIIKSRRYKYICLDFNADTSPQMIFLLQCCSRVFLIEDDSPLSKYRNRRLLNYLNYNCGENPKDQIIRIHNKWTGDSERLQQKETITVDYDTDSFRYCETHIEISINQGFGMGVKKIAEEIRRKV